MSENPFKSDSKLRSLLEEAGTIKSGESFLNWKASFLRAYENYLDPDGVLNARDASDRLVTKLQSLAKVSLKVQGLTQNGNICETQVTAEGRRALSKWTEEIKAVETAVNEFCPKSSTDADTVGYDKFELGAVLIKNGFQAYEIMLTNRDFINELREGPLKGLLDPNAISIMDFYAREMQTFVDVMNDLGLMKLMTQCIEIYKDEPRPDPKTEPEMFSEPQDREEVEINSNRGKGPNGANKKTKGSGSGKKNPKKGAASKSAQGKKTKGNDEDEFAGKDVDEDMELPPPPPAEGEGGEGEKIIYFDPKTGAIGLLPRDKCAADTDLMFGKNDAGEVANNGAIDSQGEKENIIWLLKKLEKKEKPKEGGWLEEIKKEKAARNAEAAKMGVKKKPAVRVKKEPVAGEKPARKPSKTGGNGARIGASSPKGTGFINPLEQGSSSSAKKKDSTERQRTKVEDYHGKYKEKATKPTGTGWEKVSSHNPK